MTEQDQAATIGEIRARIRRALDGATALLEREEARGQHGPTEKVAGGYPRDWPTGKIERLAATYVTLGGDLELGPSAGEREAAALEGELYATRRELDALAAAADNVLLALDGHAADEFAGRLDDLLEPLRALETARQNQATA